jgi:hypothetical protein
VTWYVPSLFKDAAKIAFLPETQNILHRGSKKLKSFVKSNQGRAEKQIYLQLNGFEKAGVLRSHLTVMYHSKAFKKF